jgi:hypothetical protein
MFDKNPEYNARTKHIDIRHHFIKEKINEKLIKVEYVSTEDMLADIFTKAVPRIKHFRAFELLALIN